VAAHWVAASAVLGRPVTDDEPYPHICRQTLTAGTVSGRPVYLDRRDCAACARERHHRATTRPDTTGGDLVDLAAARARRTARKDTRVA